MTKATMATVKAFIRNNREALLISCISSFDGMTDGVVSSGDRSFRKAETAGHLDATMGVEGAWFVSGSRNHITPLDVPGFTGFHIYNCCGSFDLAVQS